MIAQIEEAYAGDSSSYRRDEAIRNASLAAMQPMLAAKAKGLDSGPLVGFDANAFVKAFHVPPMFPCREARCQIFLIGNNPIHTQKRSLIRLRYFSSLQFIPSFRKNESTERWIGKVWRILGI
ncbi:hypothetical protein QJ48_26320 [Paenibacillus sp. A3]|nr:hypothetical protein QJ48_26320 [Paenibacillus sp. A3]